MTADQAAAAALLRMEPAEYMAEVARLKDARVVATDGGEDYPHSDERGAYRVEGGARVYDGNSVIRACQPARNAMATRSMAMPWMAPVCLADAGELVS